MRELLRFFSQQFFSHMPGTLPPEARWIMPRLMTTPAILFKPSVQTADKVAVYNMPFNGNRTTSGTFLEGVVQLPVEGIVKKVSLLLRMNPYLVGYLE